MNNTTSGAQAPLHRPQHAEEQILSVPALIIGAGGAGLRAAIELKEQGVDVLVVGKRRHDDAHTVLAAGGINAALATMDAEDSWQQHAADTIKESYFLGNPVIAEIVAKNAPRGIEDLVRYGMPFARESDGRISQRFFGAHKYRRTAYAGDYTGLEIQCALVGEAQRLGVRIIDHLYISKILTDDHGEVFGAYGFDIDDGTRVVVHADAVVLAAGGHNRIWRRTSSRRDENTGDSFRLAVEAGGRIRDAELVQFHPSGIIEPESEAGTLVSEAARGEGGILRNGLGERYMERYDPQRMELSTRDRVALASYTEIKEGRGTERGGVWLDVSHLPREVILTKLPRVYSTILEIQQKDITREPVEIAPTAHYSMGGVWVDAQTHETGVPGLWAIGEASSGLHGANRLGGNSLIELLVYGRIVGEQVAEHLRERTTIHRDPAAVAQARAEIDWLLLNDGSENVRSLQRAVRDVMTEHAGVVRDEQGLTEGRMKIDQIEQRLLDIGVHPDIASFGDLAHALDLKSSILAAKATLDSALERRETRGAHNRSDYPQQDPSLQVNLVWQADGTVTREPIPAIPDEIADLIEDISTDGKLVE